MSRIRLPWQRRCRLAAAHSDVLPAGVRDVDEAAGPHLLQIHAGPDRGLRRLTLDRLQQNLGQPKQLGVALGSGLHLSSASDDCSTGGVRPGLQGLDVDSKLWEAGGERRLEPRVGILDGLCGDPGQAGGGTGGEGSGKGSTSSVPPYPAGCKGSSSVGRRRPRPCGIRGLAGAGRQLSGTSMATG